MIKPSLKSILEAAILAAGEPLNLNRLRELFTADLEPPTLVELQDALSELTVDSQEKCMELKEVASGYCFQIKTDFNHWLKKLWQERVPRYSRALLETLAVIAYRQPITRSEIEEIRGVSINSNTIKMLLEREWIVVVGQKEVPGKPSIYGTTRQFLDYFNLKNIDELPLLAEPKNLEEIALRLENQLAVKSPEDILENHAFVSLVNDEKKLEHIET